MPGKKRLTITKVTPAYWNVSIDNPPINLYDPEMFAEINVLLDALETDPEAKVVVLQSANPDFWVAHYDFNRADVIPNMPGAAPYTEWPHMVARFSQSRVLSVAKLRARTRPGLGASVGLRHSVRFEGESDPWSARSRCRRCAGGWRDRMAFSLGRQVPSARDRVRR